MTKIDFNEWPRKDTYLFFKNFEKPYYAVTTQVDITQTFRFFEDHQISKYNGFLWIIAAAANSVDELKTRIRDDETVVLHDLVDPSFTVLSDQQNLAFCTVRYDMAIPSFFNHVNTGTRQVKENPNLEDEPGRDDLIFVSCLPWVNFTSITHPMSADSTDCIPRISWGKFCVTPEQITMPVNIQVHHGLADGFHLGLFFKKMESLLADPSALDWPIG